MLDGNSAAEIENDMPRTAMQRIQERLQIAEDLNRWTLVRDSLLKGNVEKNEFDQEFSLNARLSNEYVEFSDLADQGFDIMAAYNRGELHPAIRELIKQEANTLASVVVG